MDMELISKDLEELKDVYEKKLSELIKIQRIIEIKSKGGEKEWKAE